MVKIGIRTLIAFYSLEGNTRFVAQAMAEAVQADLLELELLKPMPQGFFKYLWGGMLSLFKAKPALRPWSRDIGQYDLIVIGTPVWGDQVAAPLNTFNALNPLRDRKIALFCCSGGGQKKVLSAMRRMWAGNDIVGETEFINTLQLDPEKNKQQAQVWVQQMVSSLTKEERL